MLIYMSSPTMFKLLVLVMLTWLRNYIFSVFCFISFKTNCIFLHLENCLFLYLNSQTYISWKNLSRIKKIFVSLRFTTIQRFSEIRAHGENWTGSLLDQLFCYWLWLDHFLWVTSGQDWLLLCRLLLFRVCR